jgi:hypothetical protein
VDNSSEPDPRLEGADDALDDWQQGDCVLGEFWFAWRFCDTMPITPSAKLTAESGTDGDIVEEQVEGLAIVTQTCDIVRPFHQRPFLEVSPLVLTEDIRAVECGKRPRYAYLPGLKDRGLVADLDRVMVIEKPFFIRHERVRGCLTDEDVRHFSDALSRKRSRFAFPDDFVALVKPFFSRFSNKYKKNSSEGEALRGLREIRVQASPSWGEQEVELFFHFIQKDDETPGDLAPHDQLEAWLALIQPNGRFTSIHGQIAYLEDLTAAEYVHSDRLDFDSLTLSFLLRD